MGTAADRVYMSHRDRHDRHAFELLPIGRGPTLSCVCAAGDHETRLYAMWVAGPAMPLEGLRQPHAPGWLRAGPVSRRAQDVLG